MTFLEQRFFDNIAPRASGGPEYRTTIKTLRGGGEHRNALWADPLRSMTFALGPRDKSAVQQILDFVAVTRGAANGFRVKDWSDFQVDWQWQATGDGTAYWFRLYKHYGQVYSRRILKPVPGTLKVKLNGATLHPSLYTMGTANGVLILKNAPVPGVAITASFEFDMPARFTDDMTQIAMLYHRLGTVESIGVREIRLREVIDVAAIDAMRALL